jgi:hypothetical protein
MPDRPADDQLGCDYLIFGQAAPPQPGELDPNAPGCHPAEPGPPPSTSRSRLIRRCLNLLAAIGLMPLCAIAIPQDLWHRTPAYGLAQPRGDLERFVFLLGGSDGEPLFSV